MLGAFRDHLVVVGGWVPELLFPGREHIGSLDVDLAVAPTALSGSSYRTICRSMLDAGYSHHTSPTRFSKAVAGAPDPVNVDLISGQSSQGEKSVSIQVNEMQINSVRDIDLVFEACDEVEISGRMPDDSVNAVRARIVRPEVFILIKAFSLDERAKKKDAYDIAFVLDHYEPTLAILAGRMWPHAVSGLSREAYELLRAKFAAVDAVGPFWAARAVPGIGDDIDQLQRAAYEDAQELFRLVDSRSR